MPSAPPAASGCGGHSGRARATEAHVCYHARHRLEAVVGNREIRSPVEPYRGRVPALRAEYEAGLRAIVDAGVAEFKVTSAPMVSYAVLDLGMGVAAWYRENRELAADTIVWQYGDFALPLAGCESGKPVTLFDGPSAASPWRGGRRRSARWSPGTRRTSPS
ncbi:hypothetical protein ACFYM3_43730 [Streptomyces massasporeus]|uniref:HTH-type transcriptional repressor KstR2 C-terminal domain-containing protein n=2 Tax=Streptomyces massasporeus TaxID=67324 RepID=A0ABW6LSL7_9ACTN